MKENINNRIEKIKYFDEKIENNKKYTPKNLMLEVTNDCNLKCIFCANHNMTRKRKCIDKKIVKKSLEQARKLGIKEVGLYANGEPLLNRNIDDYIKQAKELSYNYIYITTNGVLAKKDKIKKLFEMGLNSIKFSINSIYEDNYFMIHGVNCFDLVMKNLKEVYNMKEKYFPDRKVYVSYIKTKVNNFSDERIREFFQQYCDNFSIQHVRNQGGLIANIDELKLDTENSLKLPCYYPFNSIIVTCEGYITACCMDFQNYLTYGDLNKENMQDIWNNSIIKSFREKQLNGNIGNTICENCYNNKFKKCDAILEKLSCKINFDDWR